MIRIAAMGDLHLGTDAHGHLKPALHTLSEYADLLLLAGDLTQHGTVAEAKVVADELMNVGVPIIAVLGNHDYHSDRPREITEVLQDAGVVMLEGTTAKLEVDGQTIGVAGIKGFGGGFPGRCGTEFGEPEMKAFVRHSADQAIQLTDALRQLDTDVIVALTHYSPVADTLQGEPLEIYPFLGSYLLAEAIDASKADFAIHGHAHFGVEKGITPGGTKVRNVAQPVIKHAYAVYQCGFTTAQECA